MTSAEGISFELDGVQVQVRAEGLTLLEVLRDRLGKHTVKDGCSPQGQCGCCTVWVDGQPRVACVTPSARVQGRVVTTVAALPDADWWGERLCDAGGSQCGFCTPGIVMRLAAIPHEQRNETVVRQALLAHLCRCTGWQTIVEAACGGGSGPRLDRGLAARRAAIEGGVPQVVDADVALGRVPFAADAAPVDAVVAVLNPDGSWITGETAADARREAGAQPGRRTTEALTWPLDALVDGLSVGLVGSGEPFVVTLHTTWVEPGYLEPDAAWCVPGGAPVGPLTNGGAFGAKVSDPAASEVAMASRRLADELQRPVLAMYSRGDVVRRSAKRPPMVLGVRADGSGVAHVVRTPGIAAAIATVAPGLEVIEHDVAGPPTSAGVRGAGWVEAAVAVAAATGTEWISAPNGARARAWVDGGVRVEVECGEALDQVVLRSYCIGAAHMALGWVRNEAIVVNAAGEPLDITVRSMGVLRAVDTPHIDVSIVESTDDPVNGSDAVFAAVALAAWRAEGLPSRWPTMRS